VALEDDLAERWTSAEVSDMGGTLLIVDNEPDVAPAPPDDLSQAARSGATSAGWPTAGQEEHRGDAGRHREEDQQKASEVVQVEPGLPGHGQHDRAGDEATPAKA
jgi:hypothetical protein